MDCEINLTGHVHNRWAFKRLVKGEKITDCINVGVDVNNFYPVTFEEIMSKYYKWKKTNGYK
jgi:calcineurin-like phosphoesterase family protein